MRLEPDLSTSLLEWGLSCPDLLSPEQTAFKLFPTVQREEIAALLSFKPNDLLDHFSQSKSHFIGPLFESIWLYYFERSSHYQLITHNQQFTSQGKTLGEIDFLVLDRRNQRLVHVEVAVKFYLQKQDSRGDLEDWVGPNAIDRLDLKLAKFRQQLQLSQNPEIRKLLDINADSEIDQKILLKGILFHTRMSHGGVFETVIEDAPTIDSTINPEHLRGTWSHINTFIDQLVASPSDAKEVWRILPKPYWMTPKNCAPIKQLPPYTPKTLSNHLSQSDLYERAHLLSRWHIDGDQEIELERLMVVPSTWPTRTHPTPSLQSSGMDK